MKVVSRHCRHWAIAAALAAILGACADGGGGDSQTLAVGDAYPALSVSDCGGTAVDLRTWIGAHDVVYLSFAAGWCQSCQEEAPRLERELVDQLAGKNVGVAQILMENDADTPPTLTLCGAWKSELKVSYDVFADLQQVHLAPIFGGKIANLPVHVVATRDGIVRYKRICPLPDDIQQIVTDWLP